MASKTFDPSKFRTSLTKSISGMSAGFHDPTDWVSTGNYALNYLISGDFHKGIPLGKVSVFAGESGSGKSYICSGNIAKSAQEQGIYVVLVDTENALDEVFTPSVAVILKLYVVSDSISGAVPVKLPLEEFKDIHDGRLDDEYTIEVPSGSVAETEALSDVPSSIVAINPEEVFHVGVPPILDTSLNTTSLY